MMLGWVHLHTLRTYLRNWSHLHDCNMCHTKGGGGTLNVAISALMCLIWSAFNKVVCDAPGDELLLTKLDLHMYIAVATAEVDCSTS